MEPSFKGALGSVVSNFSSLYDTGCYTRNKLEGVLNEPVSFICHMHLLAM